MEYCFFDMDYLAEYMDYCSKIMDYCSNKGKKSTLKTDNQSFTKEEGGAPNSSEKQREK